MSGRKGYEVVSERCFYVKFKFKKVNAVMVAGLASCEGERK